MNAVRLIPHGDMTAAQLLGCSYQAQAILTVCIEAAGSAPPSQQLGGAIGLALQSALDLLAPVHDALEAHEGVVRP